MQIEENPTSRTNTTRHKKKTYISYGVISIPNPSNKASAGRTYASALAVYGLVNRTVSDPCNNNVAGQRRPKRVVIGLGVQDKRTIELYLLFQIILIEGIGEDAAFSFGPREDVIEHAVAGVFEGEDVLPIVLHRRGRV